MTTVSSVSNTATTGTTATTSSASSLDYNSFLKLLIAQLKNQDPTSPMDSAQFVSELATFSQVEQSVTTNSKLDSLLTSQSLTMADAFIGHTVTSSDGTTERVRSPRSRLPAMARSPRWPTATRSSSDRA